MKHVEIVAIPNARNSPKQAAISEEGWPNIRCAGYPSKIVGVQLQGSQSNQREEHNGCPFFGSAKGILTDVTDGVDPGDWILLATLFLGRFLAAAGGSKGPDHRYMSPGSRAVARLDAPGRCPTWLQ
jgi:hypothetical protein